MSEKSISIIEKLENQVAQAILYLGSIEVLAEAYRENETLRGDPFLFSTVYQALWDALIVRIGTIWDSTKSVASLPQLAKDLKRVYGQSAKMVVLQIESQKKLEKNKIEAWRNNVIAHTNVSLDLEEFDLKNKINSSEVRFEIERIEGILSRINEIISRNPTFYEVLKEDALRNARGSLSRWQVEPA